MMGCRLAYGQSDEYSFLLTDFERNETEMWFSGNVQKIASVSASIFTASFNRQWGYAAHSPARLAYFDSRAFIISGRQAVEEYFIWRQTDASRNSLNTLAGTLYSAKELMGKNSSSKHAMLNLKGCDWNTYGADFKWGRIIRRVPNKRTITFTHKKTNEVISKEIDESVWSVDKNIPIFAKTKGYLDSLIPILS